METHARTLAKTISYRVMAAFITAVLAWTLTGNLTVGLTLGLVDTVVKLGFFYFHERLWARVRGGYTTLNPAADVASR